MVQAYSPDLRSRVIKASVDGHVGAAGGGAVRRRYLDGDRLGEALPAERARATAPAAGQAARAPGSTHTRTSSSDWWRQARRTSRWPRSPNIFRPNAV